MTTPQPNQPKQPIQSMGGKARAASLPAERRSEIAKAAAVARWSSPDGGIRKQLDKLRQANVAANHTIGELRRNMEQAEAMIGVYKLEIGVLRQKLCDLRTHLLFQSDALKSPQDVYEVVRRDTLEQLRAELATLAERFNTTPEHAVMVATAFATTTDGVLNGRRNELAALRAREQRLREALEGMLGNYIELKRMTLRMARRDTPSWVGTGMTAEDDIHVIAARQALAAVEQVDDPRNAEIKRLREALEPLIIECETMAHDLKSAGLDDAVLAEGWALLCAKARQALADAEKGHP